MKLLRVGLLVLLALLLPVRGAMAATLSCLPASGTVSAETRAIGHGAHHSAETLRSDVEAPLPHEHADPAQHGHDHAEAPANDVCKMCSASCSAPPLQSAIDGFAERRDLTRAEFPSLALPAASFLSGGQERPPRRI